MYIHPVRITLKYSIQSIYMYPISMLWSKSKVIKYGRERESKDDGTKGSLFYIEIRDGSVDQD